MNRKTFSFSLGCLNPVSGWLHADPAWGTDGWTSTTATIRMIAKALRRVHFGASLTLDVLADKIEAWRIAVDNLTADPTKADSCWDQLIEQLAIVAGSPWCVRLQFWERVDGTCEDGEEYGGNYLLTPFDLKRLRKNPLDHKSRRGLRRVIFDRDCAELAVSIEFN
jgi:hypothetical protein